MVDREASFVGESCWKTEVRQVDWNLQIKWELLQHMTFESTLPASN
jgi:hypothetical protein